MQASSLSLEQSGPNNMNNAVLTDTHPCAPASSDTAEARSLIESMSDSAPISALTAVTPAATMDTSEQIIVNCSGITVLQRLAVGDFVKIQGLKEHDWGTLTNIYDDGYATISLSVNVSLLMLLQKFSCLLHSVSVTLPHAVD